MSEIPFSDPRDVQLCRITFLNIHDVHVYLCKPSEYVKYLKKCKFCRKRVINVSKSVQITMEIRKRFVVMVDRPPGSERLKKL